MVFLDGLGGLVILALWIFCFIDVVLTPQTACRNLPKLAWVFIVLLLPDIGSIAWLVAGHPWNRATVPAQRSGPVARSTGVKRPARTVATNPDDDEEFLAGLRERAEEQRRRARHQDPQQDKDRLDGDKS